jgi:hypothetical protein
MLISNSISRNSQINYKTNFRGLALLIAVSIIFFLNNLAFAQGNWEDTTSNPKTWTTGKVGIGTDDPQEQLHINGAIRGYDSIEGALRINTGHGILDIGSQNSGYSHIKTDRSRFYFNRPIYVNSGMIGSYHTNNLSLHTHGTTRMTILNSNGNVGIGTSLPVYSLDVVGTIASTGNSGIVQMFNADANTAVLNGVNDVQIRTGNAPRLTIKNNGNVGIGTINPQSKLAVNGKVTCTEVEVTLNGWSDFVFADDYELMPLVEVEQHIKKNKHLPDIPSEKEVLENGLDLGNMQAKLLQKLEELTLYVIAQNKELKHLKNENEGLKIRIGSLEK